MGACTKPIGCVMGKDGIVRFGAEARGRQMAVPCGRCMDCRLEFSRQWAMRCVHESKLHDENCWFTLTYDEEHLPYAGSLVKEHLQLFYKRLRKANDCSKIRYYSAGEYGSDSGRPHYHVCCFGFDFRDKFFWRLSDSGADVYRSDELDRIWGKGLTELGDLTFESAAYTARYCCKKVTGDMAEDHYTRMLQDGRFVEVEPEFALMSRGGTGDGLGGIGSGHYAKYGDEIYPQDECIVRGNRSKPPRFYDKLLEKESIEVYERVKAARRDFAESNKEEQVLQRRTSREKVTKAKMDLLIRGL